MSDVIVPFQRKSFQGIVKPGMFDPRGVKPGGKPTVRAPEKEETTQTHWQRLEATRQWLVKRGPYGCFAADVLIEQFHRITALKQYVETMPEGEAKTVLRRIADGKLTVVNL